MNSRIRRAAAIARDIFGVRGEVHPLPGESDLNFRVSGPEGDIVLKLGHLSRLPVFDLVTSCLYHLAAAKFPGRVPRPVAPAGTAAPTRVARVTFEGAPYVACAVTWLDGITLAELRPRSLTLLEDLGVFLAGLDAALADFEHPALDRDFAWRMESAPSTIRDHLDDLESGRDLVEVTLDRAVLDLDPVADELPGAVIHNDGNDFNVLVRPSLEGARLAGLIDFGDVVRGWRAAEVAIAATYAMMEMADPLDAACAVARGYAFVTPLTAEECRAILPMVALRLCQSVSVQARQMREQPGNEYLAVSQEAAWRLLKALARTDWRIGEFRIREACGLVPNPGLATVRSWMKGAEARSPVMPSEVLSRPRALTMSVESPDLPHPDHAAQPGAAEAWIERRIAHAQATVGVGRYGEARLLYDTPAFRAPGDNGPESRTVHLGLDLFAPPATPVHAPLAGTVLAVAHNDRPLDYGPTVVLRHAAPDGTGFHTLYGHLDRATLDHLSPGDRVSPGDVIGWLGDASVNGGWPPHLHLQVMALDPLYADGTPPHERGNFPGVVLHRLRTAWESVLPDPTPLAGLPAGTPTSVAPAEEPVLRKRVLNEKRKTVLGSSLSLSYADPVHVVRGVGAYLYDDTGRRYLDTVNNVPHVGHGNPRVAEAIARQSRVLNTNTRYLHSEIVALADELLAHFPDPLDVVFPVCSGSEANELALRMARCHTGNDGVVCVEGGYHGNTGGLVEISHYKFAGPGGAGPSDRVVAAAMPDVYRGRFRRGEGVSDEELGVRYAGEVGRAVRAASGARTRRRGLRGRADPELRGPDRAAAGLPGGRVPACARGGRGVRRGRGAGGVRARGRRLLGLRTAGGGAGHRDAGQTDGERAPGRGGGDDSRNRGLLRQRDGVFQHVRGEPGVVRGGAGGAGGDRGAGVGGACARGGGGVGGGVGGTGGAASAGGGCAGAGAVPGDRDRARPEDAGAVPGGVRVHCEPGPRDGRAAERRRAGPQRAQGEAADGVR